MARRGRPKIADYVLDVSRFGTGVCIVAEGKGLPDDGEALARALLAVILQPGEQVAQYDYSASHGHCFTIGSSG